MKRQKVKEYLESLTSQTLTDVNLACDMMMFTFEDISLHSQCFTRIMCREKVLLTTSDYQNWDGAVETNNDEWYNLSKHKNQIVKNKVIKTELTDTNDAFIWLENEIRIQIFISNGSPHYGEDYEQWRIFENSNSESQHFVIYSQSIQIEE